MFKHSNETVFFLSSEESCNIVETVGNFVTGEMRKGHFVGNFGVRFGWRIVVDIDGVDFLGFLFWRWVLIYIDSFSEILIFSEVCDGFVLNVVIHYSAVWVVDVCFEYRSEKLLVICVHVGRGCTSGECDGWSLLGGDGLDVVG